MIIDECGYCDKGNQQADNPEIPKNSRFMCVKRKIDSFSYGAD